MKKYTSSDIIAFLEYHNRPNRWGFYRRITGNDFVVQCLPLDEIAFDFLISDFFITFDVCSKRYNPARHFPPSGCQQSGLRSIVALGSRRSKNSLTPITVQDLTDAANERQWPASLLID